MQNEDNSNWFDGMRKSGVRRGVIDPFAYELAVLPVDVADAVRSAGGWLCDRVRAGWKVNVFVDEGADGRGTYGIGPDEAADHQNNPGCRDHRAEALAGQARNFELEARTYGGPTAAGVVLLVSLPNRSGALRSREVQCDN